MRLDEIENSYPYKWNEKTIISDFRGYKIAINSINYPTYLTAWTNDNEKIGYLELNPVRKNNKEWLSIGSVEINPKYRKEGIATELYRAALKWLPAEYEGLYSYLPNAPNKNAHRIHKRLGGEVIDDDHVFIKRNDSHEIR